MTSTRYVPPGRRSNDAVIPIHLTACSGSTSSSHTVSGRAAIAISRTTVVLSAVASMRALLLSLGLALQRLEPFVPEPVEERPQLAEAFGSRPVQASCAVPPFAHETGLLQDVQVLGDGRPRHVEMRRDLAGRQLPVADERQDAPPSGLRDRFQGRLHRRYLSNYLRKCQLTPQVRLPLDRIGGAVV